MEKARRNYFGNQIKRENKEKVKIILNIQLLIVLMRNIMPLLYLQKINV